MTVNPGVVPQRSTVRAVDDRDLEELGEAAAEIQGRSPWQLAWVQLSHDRVAIGSTIIIALITLAAVFAPLIARLVGHGLADQYPYTALNGYGLPVGPSRTFLFGADDLGRDVMVRVAYGGRVSLIAGVVASGVAVIVGGIVGLVAGYFGTVVDTALSRFMDVILAFPLLLFVIELVAIVAVVSPSLTMTIAVIAFFS